MTHSTPRRLIATAAIADAHALALPVGQLTATVDAAARTVEGIIVPWGEPGRTNLGLRSVRRGALRLADRVIGINGHDRERPVSRLIASEDRPEGLWGRLRIAETPAGDQLLAEVRAGIRDGLSIEASELVFDTAGNGELTAGRVDFVAHVPVPAYASAHVTSLNATATIPPVAPVVVPPAAPAAAEPAPAAGVLTGTPAIDYGQLAAALAPMLSAIAPAVAPGGIPSSALPGLAPSAGPVANLEDPLERAATLQAAVFQGTATAEMRAALQDITNTGLSLFQNPSALGEKLWEGASYTRRFVQLMRPQPLTSYKGTGWQWVDRPKVQDWAGDKTQIPSNPVSVIDTEWTAERCAGGWDIDRKFRDFGDAQFWSEFYAAQTESYLELSDGRAAAALVEFAFDITDPAVYPANYAVPNGFGGLLVDQTDVLQAAALASAILEDTPRVRRTPEYLVMNTGDWLGLSKLTNLDLPAFLALLKVDPGSFMRSSLVPAGRLVAGVRNASTFRELGATPIRVEALDVARGGIDSAVFGYTATHMDRPGGIISVPLVAAGG